MNKFRAEHLAQRSIPQTQSVKAKAMKAVAGYNLMFCEAVQLPVARLSILLHPSGQVSKGILLSEELWISE